MASTARRQWRRWACVLALVALVAFAAVLAVRPSADPLARRLVGTWELRAAPSADPARRTVEFHDDGKFCVYPKGKRNVATDTYRNLVVVFDDPLAQPAPAATKLKEAARRIIDPSNEARSYRYAVSDDGRNTITISLIKERGNPPAQVEGATLIREGESPH